MKPNILLLLFQTFCLLHQLRACPCTVEDGTLKCQLFDTIKTFPSDFLNHHNCSEEITLSDDVQDIHVLNQPNLVHLGPRAFAEFPLTQAINFNWNGLATIDKDAFQGPHDLNTINLMGNRIEELPKSTFDLLYHLKYVNLSNNSRDDEQKIYTSTHWHLSTREKGQVLKFDPGFVQDLRPSQTTHDYCEAHEEDIPIRYACIEEHDGDWNCGPKIDQVACQLKELEFNKVTFPFPLKEQLVMDFYEAEENEFFQTFNFDASSTKAAKVMTNLTLYGTKFDLSTLDLYVGNKTEEITIFADTIWMSRPLSFSLYFKLKLRARIISLNHLIYMIYDKDDFFPSNDTGRLEPWALSEKHVTLDTGITMQVLQYGHVDILREKPDITIVYPDIVPVIYDITKFELDRWYDDIGIYLNYVGARTLLATGKNDDLVNKMSQFFLDFAYSKEVVDNDRAYMASRKFLPVLDMIKHSNSHNVPIYSISTIGDLSRILQVQLSAYHTNELASYNLLHDMMMQVETMQVQFDLAAQERQLYFEMEKAILEEIFSARNRTWHWEFEHRQTTENLIKESMDIFVEQIYAIKMSEYELLLEEAKQGVSHMEDVIISYENQLERHIMAANASFEVIGKLSKKLSENTDRLQGELDEFSAVTNEVSEERPWRIVKSTFRGLGCVGLNIFGRRKLFNVGKCIKNAYPDDDLQSQLDAMEDLYNVLSTLSDMMQELLEEIERIYENHNGSLDFEAALKHAISAKELAPAFDDFEVISKEKVDDLERAYGDKIDYPLSDLTVAGVGVCDVGQRLAEECVTYADAVLKASDKQDELNVAREDLVRSIEHVENIESTIVHLENLHIQMTADLESARTLYEEEVNALREEYANATMEELAEFQETISDLYDTYNEMFEYSKNIYNKEMSIAMEAQLQRRYGLYDHSMTQRAMVFSLFVDYCDAMFFHSFSECSLQEVPMMSDDFIVLMEKLGQIEWDSITSADDLHGVPITFGHPNPIRITVQDDPSRWDYPVQKFKNESTLEINLKQYDHLEHFKDYWRIRIEMLRVVFLDTNGHVIPSWGTNFGEEVQVMIKHPTMFNDTDRLDNCYLFLSRRFLCNADYYTLETVDDSIAPHFTTSCEVSKEFSSTNYHPSIDGIFTIQLRGSSSEFALHNVSYLRFELAGSYIPKAPDFY